MWVYLGLFYIAAVSILVVFLAGAAKVNQKWDRARDHRLFRIARRQRPQRVA
jgi:hypothetical protein